jgi:hypothetical protein
MTHDRARLERRLHQGGLALLALLVIGCLWAASRQWFSGDDFSFLRHVREASPVSWWWPLGERHWIFYRPLGMHSYYWACLGAFGANPFPFLVVSIAAGLTAALVAAGIARRLGLSPPAVAVTTLATFSALCTTGVLQSPTTFHYVAALLATGLSLRFFLDASRTASFASCVALGMGLLCNEIAALIPVAAFALALARDASLSARTLTCAAARTAPLALLVAVYLSLRFSVLDSDLPESYSIALGAHLPRNAALQLIALFGGVARGLVALSLALALAWMARRHARPVVAPLLACGGWLLAGITPFSLMLLPRAPIAIVLPVALALGLIVDRFFSERSGRRPLATALAIAALGLALLPVETLVEQARSPVGAIAKRLHRIAAQRLAPGETTWLFVLHGGPGLGGAEVVRLLEWNLFGRGTAFAKALFPERDGVQPLRIRFVDVSRVRRIPRSVGRCVYLAARPDGSLEVSDAETARSLTPALRERCDVRRDRR